MEPCGIDQCMNQRKVFEFMTKWKSDKELMTCYSYDHCMYHNFKKINETFNMKTFFDDYVPYNQKAAYSNLNSYNRFNLINK